MQHKYTKYLKDVFVPGRRTLLVGDPDVDQPLPKTQSLLPPRPQRLVPPDSQRLLILNRNASFLLEHNA